MHVDLEVGRTALRESTTAFVEAAGSLDELALLGASRCHGWARLDVVSHLLGGWQELLGGIARPTDAEPDVDAASYWTSWRADQGDADPVDALMWQRRRTSVYRRPALAVAELRDVADALDAAVEALDGRSRSFQGHVLAPGDLCATWAVENAVHHLDLLVDAAPPAVPLGLARATVVAIAGDVPPSWSDTDAVLIGSGRLPVPPDAGEVGERLPALG